MSWTREKTAVLVPFDFTDNSREALTTARAFVDEASAIDVVYVMAPPTPPAPGLMWGDMDLSAVRERAEESFAGSHRTGRVCRRERARLDGHPRHPARGVREGTR